eukprot:g3951.t1
MPVLSELSEAVLEQLRLRYKQERSKRYQREKKRISSILADLREFATSPPAQEKIDEFEKVKPQHIKDINAWHINYDKDFSTGRVSAWIWGQLGQWSNYLDEERRAVVFGKYGMMQCGLPTHGTVPIYGCWPGAKKLTEVEQARATGPGLKFAR